MLVATPVRDTPVYYGFQVPDEVQEDIEQKKQSWLKRKQKYLFGIVGLLFGMAVTVGATVLYIGPNDTATSGSLPKSGGPSIKSNNTDNKEGFLSASLIESKSPSPSSPSWPSSAPSISYAPSREHKQVISTDSGGDLQLGGRVTSSYGYLWNMRTKPDSGVIVITGMDFYTESTNNVTFELWTRMGTFKGFKGSYEGWDLIANGTTMGRGVEQHTAIPEEMYTPVSIPGGGEDNGGIRSFYLTLDKRELVYKRGSVQDGESADSDAFMHHGSSDLEIWEGEGILSYPFPDSGEDTLYRKPRQYLGAIYYDRLPCRPSSLYANYTLCSTPPSGILLSSSLDSQNSSLHPSLPPSVSSSPSNSLSSRPTPPPSSPSSEIPKFPLTSNPPTIFDSPGPTLNLTSSGENMVQVICFYLKLISMFISNIYSLFL